MIFLALYPSFLEANQESASLRLVRIKQLLHQLPRHNFETFRVIAQHLNAVAGMEQTNMVVVLFSYDIFCGINYYSYVTTEIFLCWLEKSVFFRQLLYWY